MECNNDINSMIDLAKVADLVSTIMSDTHKLNPFCELIQLLKKCYETTTCNILTLCIIYCFLVCVQVLLLVDASFGFEMETFEFLNICQVHGFPKIMGVLTHLDAFKDNKQMRKTKKRLKHRFWTEVYQVSCSVH